MSILLNGTIPVSDLARTNPGPNDAMVGVDEASGAPRRFPLTALPLTAPQQAALDEMQEQVDALNAGSKRYSTWAAASADIANIPTNSGVDIVGDTGTHTDPVSGATVSNSGRFVKVSAGLQWVSSDTLAAKAEKSYVDANFPAVEEISDDVFVLTDVQGNKSWMEADSSTGKPTARVANALLPFLKIGEAVDQATAAMPSLVETPGDEFVLTDPRGFPSWMRAALGTGRPTDAVAHALANVLHYYVGQTQPPVWPGNWLIWTQVDASHNPIQTFIVEN